MSASADAGRSGREPWRRRAACLGLDPDLFFPPEADACGLSTSWSAAPAQAVCARCPVRQDCRDWALATHQPDGVWGGLSPSELRRRWQRPRSRQARAS